jgi:hypothetical protein
VTTVQDISEHEGNIRGIWNEVPRALVNDNKVSVGARATLTFLSKLVETISYNDNRVLASSIRLGQVFNWLLDGGLSITGQAYFAVARKFPWEEVCCQLI